MTFFYRVHGLSVQSQIELPELIEAIPADLSDVRITLGRALREPSAFRHCEDGFLVGRDEICFHVPGVATFHVTAGTTVVVQPDAKVEPSALRLYLLGSAFAAVLHQRKLFPIHASAFEKDGECIGFMGDSGNGKSTMAAMLAGRGFRLISDDVLVVRLNEQGELVASPSVPILKLWPQSLAPAGLPADAGQIDTIDALKRRVDAREVFQSQTWPLRRLYLLRWLLPATAPMEIEPLPVFTSMMVLRHNIYCPSLIDAMGAEGHFLRFSKQLLATTEIFSMRRGMSLGMANSQVSAILKSYT